MTRKYISRFEKANEDHRTEVFMKLNGLTVNEHTGKYEYNEDLKVTPEEMKDPTSPHFDAAFKNACDKVDLLRAAESNNTLNLEESQASVWRHISLAGAGGKSGKSGKSPVKVAGKVNKIDVPETGNVDVPGEANESMSVAPDGPIELLGGGTVTFNQLSEKEDPVLVTGGGGVDYSALPPEEKGGKGGKPIHVPGAPEGQNDHISGPSILMVPPDQPCEPGQFICGGRCTHFAATASMADINCLCLGNCRDVDDGECDGFSYTDSEGSSACCDNASYCPDGSISCGQANQCGNSSVEIPMPESAQQLIMWNDEESGAYTVDGNGEIFFPFCQPVYPDAARYPDPRRLHELQQNEEAYRTSFQVRFNDTALKDNWSHVCVHPVIVEDQFKEVIQYTNIGDKPRKLDDELIIKVEIERLNKLWGWDYPGCQHLNDDAKKKIYADFDKAKEFAQIAYLSSTGPKLSPSEIHLSGMTVSEWKNQKHDTCDFPDSGASGGVAFDRWLITVWTTLEDWSRPVSYAEYRSDTDNHIEWVIPSFGFRAYVHQFPWAADFEMATLLFSDCNNSDSDVKFGFDQNNMDYYIDETSAG